MKRRRRARARARGGYRPSQQPTGRPRIHDGEPTPEAVAHRIRLAGGMACITGGKLVIQWMPHGDVTSTATPLDALETRRLITREQADAGRRLASLRYAIHQFPWLSALDLREGDRLAGPRSYGLPDDVLERYERRYSTALAALDACGAAVRATTTNIAIHLAWPSRSAEIDELRTGLNALRA